MLVDQVFEGTSAADGGVQAGDVILAWDGEDLAGARGLFEALQNHKPGDIVVLTILRGGEQLELRITLKAGQ
ncbi:MAG: PDZ domain-containing protein [Planctomycetota bacterium]|jgi:S1-C subfamily serine protease